MPKDKLVLDEDRRIIQWYVADIDDIGACLGEGHPHPANSKDEHEIASRAEIS